MIHSSLNLVPENRNYLKIQPKTTLLFSLLMHLIQHFLTHHIYCILYSENLRSKFSLWLYQAMNLLILVQLRYLSLLLLRGEIMNVFNFNFLIYLFFFWQILLKSPGDIRLYQIECTAIPDFSNTCIEFETPVLQKCTQDIPVVCCFFLLSYIIFGIYFH